MKRIFGVLICLCAAINYGSAVIMAKIVGDSYFYVSLVFFVAGILSSGVAVNVGMRFLINGKNEQIKKGC